jgi:hypothetical protein
LSTMKGIRIIIVICLIIVLGGCGKNIPVISPALLDSKMSVLLISTENLVDSTKSALTTTLLSWRDTYHIDFDWMANTTVLREQQLAQIKSTPYNYVIVIGNDLNRQIMSIASSFPDKKWILLDDALAVSETLPRVENVYWKQTGEGFMEKQWDEWVGQQQALGKSIEWVTFSTNPIPSLWAPSEEADTISLSDAEGWFPQFQTQVKQHSPNWIVLYSPLDATALSRVKSLKVPIMDMSATSIEVQWSVIFAALQQSITNNQWASGIQSYTTTEIKVLKS